MIWNSSGWWRCWVLAPGTAPDPPPEQRSALLHGYFGECSNTVTHVTARGQRPPTHTPTHARTDTHARTPPHTATFFPLSLFLLSSSERGQRQREGARRRRLYGCSAAGGEAAADIRLQPASTRALLEATFVLTVLGASCSRKRWKIRRGGGFVAPCATEKSRFFPPWRCGLSKIANCVTWDFSKRSRFRLAVAIRGNL